ncbi:Uncharacterised protein [uncultured archaeon]|nr:Uncharacterised protein [uncultured archaeon]
MRVECLLAPKLSLIIAQLRESLGVHVIYCRIFDVKVRSCKITTCEFYKTCHGFADSE